MTPNNLNDHSGERFSRRRFLAAGSLAALSLSAQRDAASAWEPLFDGQSLSGWHKPPKPISHGSGGRWTVDNGVLVGEQDPPGSGNGGILLSDAKFADFELSLEMRPDWGPDTGVFFRTTESGAGFQMYVDYHDGGNVGHLRGEMPGNFAIKPFQIFAQLNAAGQPAGFTTKPDSRSEKWPRGVYEYSCAPEEWTKAWRVGDWNHARIRCVGKFPQITTWINDLKVCHFNGETSPLADYDRQRVYELLGRRGSIGLQVHGGKAWPAGARCRWRKIMIKRLSAEP